MHSIIETQLDGSLQDQDTIDGVSVVHRELGLRLKCDDDPAQDPGSQTDIYGRAGANRTS